MTRKLIAAAVGAFALTFASCGGDFQARTRMVLEPQTGEEAADLGVALDDAIEIIRRRLDAFGFGDARVQRMGGDQIVVEFSEAISPEEAKAKVGRTALLQFCEPVTDDDGNVAMVRQGDVRYQPQTCEPKRDAQNNIVVERGRLEFVPWAPSGSPDAANNPLPNLIVWQPATGEVNGAEIALTGRFLQPNTFVDTDPVLERPILVFEWDEDGAVLSEQVTTRLSKRQYPLAILLDGEPIYAEDGSIIAPLVVSAIANQGTITGLSLAEAQELSILLNTGAFPVPMQVIEVQDAVAQD